MTNRTNSTGDGLSDNDTVRILQITLLTVNAVLVTFGNILVIVAFSKFKRLRSTCNILVVNLSVADLMVGVVCLPIQTILQIWPELKQIMVLCLARYCLTYVTIGASLFFLIVISADRLISLQKPLSYTTIVTKSRVTIVCASIWTFNAVTGLLPMFGVHRWEPGIECAYRKVFFDEYTVYTAGLLCAMMCVVAGIYIKVFHIAYNVISRNYGVTEGARLKRHLPAIKTFGLIVGIYCVTTMPVTLLTFVEVLRPDLVTTSTEIIRMIAFVLITINSFVNPVIYHFRHPGFRQAFKLLYQSTPCSSGSKEHDKPKLSVGLSVSRL